MIKKTLLRSIILMSFTLLLVNCSKDDETDINKAQPLVGSWRHIFLNNDENYKYTHTLKFNSNKSGSANILVESNGEIDTYNDNFTWSTDVDVLTITTSDGETNNKYYSIEGDKLSMDDSNAVYTKI